MYLIEFDNVYDEGIVKRAYEKLEDMGLISKTYIMHTISKETDIIKKYSSHFIKIDVKKIEEEDSDDLIDLLMYLEYEDMTIVIDESQVNLDYINKIRGYCDTLKIEYHSIGVIHNIDMQSGEVGYVIKELYNCPSMGGTTYGFKDFLIKFKINSKGEIYNQMGEMVGDLEDSLCRTFLDLTNNHLNMLDHIESKAEEAKEIGISLNLPTPWYYLGWDTKPDEILKYKERVFDLTKNMGAHKINELPLDTAYGLFQSRFMSLWDIRIIENKNHDLFITDWFIEAVLQK